MKPTRSSIGKRSFKMNQCLGMLQENGQLCIALACLDNATLSTSVLGSGNNKFLAKESNAPASNGLEKNREGE